MRTDSGEYFNREVFNERRKTKVKGEQFDEQQGPAFRIGLRDVMLLSHGENKCSLGSLVRRMVPDIPDIVVGADIVLALLCPVWPPEASEWLSRKRHQRWPKRALIRKCRNNGCHLVFKAHENSINPEIEFRFSFSKSETELVLSWTPVQAKIHEWLKNMKTVVNARLVNLGRTPVLCSYHIKTLMFWSCEEKPAAFWSEENSMEALSEAAYV